MLNYYPFLGNQQRVYELIVRHFLACCAKDAKGQETKVKIDIAGEKVGRSFYNKN